MNRIIAKQAHILRAHQKDEYITENLFSNLSDILYEILERNTWLQSQDLIKFTSQITYYSLTTLCDLQTLGEEYTGIVQVHGNQTKLSKKLRLLSLVLQFGGEPAIIKSLFHIREYLNHNTQIVKEARKELIEFTYKLQRLMPFLNRINKSIFFINGVYYYLSKRLTSIKYIIVKPWLSEKTPLHGYIILGVISLLYLIILFFNNSILRKEHVFYNNKKKKMFINGQSKFICSLCLGVADNPSLTDCGHIYCWHCISIWIQTRPQCPICRENIQSYNFMILKN